MISTDDRARITVPDVLFIVFSVASIAALYPVFWSGLEDRAGGMTTGELYLFQLILPFALLVVVSMVYVSAVGGR